MNAKHIQAPTSMNNFPSNGSAPMAKRFHERVLPRCRAARRCRTRICPESPSPACSIRTSPSTANLHRAATRHVQPDNVRDRRAKKTGMDKAYQKFKGTWVEPESSKEDNQAGAMFAAPEFIARTTRWRALAKQLGPEGDAVETFVAEIENYNKFCANTASTRISGRYAEVLFPVKGWSVLRAHRQSRTWRDHEHLRRNHHQRRAERPRCQLRADSRPVRFRQRLRVVVLSGIHHPHARRKPQHGHRVGPRSGQGRLPSTLRRSSCSQQRRHQRDLFCSIQFKTSCQAFQKGSVNKMEPLLSLPH